MISTSMAKAMTILPDRLVRFLSKNVVNYYLKKYATIHITGKETLEKIKAPTLFICNHLSNSDGLVLAKILKEIDPTFVAGEKLSNNAVTNIGINVVKTTKIKPDTVHNEGLKRIINLVKAGESLVIFPEGTRSRSACLIEAKKGILIIARMTGASIVPIGLSGTERLLPISEKDDMSTENFKHADVHVTIGQAFDLPKRRKDQDKKTYGEFATNYAMKKIAVLLPEPYRGYYK